MGKDWDGDRGWGGDLGSRLGDGGHVDGIVVLHSVLGGSVGVQGNGCGNCRWVDWGWWGVILCNMDRGVAVWGI